MKEKYETHNKKIKELKDLNLMDRFLFAEAIEDKEFYEALLTIIMEENITLKSSPTAEREMRAKLSSKFVRFDVLSEDTDGRIHNTEVQNDHKFKNLPRRNRYYIGVIDVNQLKPGTLDYNQLKDIVTITIASFDPFGLGKYKYTITLKCEQCPDMKYDDGITRIFLNTNGKDPTDASDELIAMLRYFANTTDENASKSDSAMLQLMHKKVSEIRTNDEIGVRYMNAWEEKAFERLEGFEEGEAKSKNETALKMKEDNMPAEKIAQYTGLSIEEIEKL